MVVRAVKAKPGARRMGKALRKAGWYLIVLAAAFLFVVPVYWMVLMSVRQLSDIFISPINWLPTPPYEFANYARVITERPFLTFFKNTTMVALLATLGNILSSTVTAYGFARIRFPGRQFLFTLLISTMMLPHQVKLIPLFMIYRNLGWLDTLKPLIVPTYFAAITPLYVFLMRQFFLAIPEDLSAAAKIDGASSIQTFVRIFLPLTKPAIITVGLFSFMDNWNEFFMPLIYINSPSKFTLALGLSSISGLNFTEWQIVMAASVMVVLPCVIVFLAAQRYFIEGIAVTGLKG